VDASSANALFGSGNSAKGDLDGSAAFQIGVGYRVSPIFRADATIGYLPGFNFSGSDQTGFGYKSDVKSLTGIVSGYADLGTVLGTGIVNPYVGASLGVARNKADDVGVTFAGGTGTLKGNSRTNFAWGLAAGVGIDVAAGVTIDVGYRYLDLGKFEIGSGNVVVNGVSGGPIDKAKGDLDAHLVTVGLRYGF